MIILKLWNFYYLDVYHGHHYHNQERATVGHRSAVDEGTNLDNG